MTEWLHVMLCGLPFSAVCVKWLGCRLHCIHTCAIWCTCETCSSTMLLSLLSLVTFDTCMSTEWLHAMLCGLEYLRSPGSIERVILYGLTFQCLDGHHLPVVVVRTYPLSYGFEHTAKLTLSCG